MSASRNAARTSAQSLSTGASVPISLCLVAVAKPNATARVPPPPSEDLLRLAESQDIAVVWIDEEGSISTMGLGLTLPAPIVPPDNYELVKVHAGLAYIVGHGPFDGPTPLVQDVVGRELTLDERYQAARMTALSMLACLRRELGKLDRVTEWYR